ncbi:hypothetical protein FRX31_011266 [Thalictrum thalictroides]|uniref:Pentatricopeptide repeat-containing protein n=1 Tax=Thalictrum thalictroides TaxID=46969 RepID=A0A7J6WP43_THATH|nr:hypothetical protein FRX31_011266 [Thalictrum thalictroides]
MGAKHQTANLLKLIKKPSTLVPPSPLSSSSLRHLTTVKTITIKDEWHGKQTCRIKVDKRIKTLLQCQDDKLKQEDHLVNLFSSTSPPRFPQFFFDNGKYGSEKGEITNLILQVLYKHSQLDYARQFLNEILDDKDFKDYSVNTKHIVFYGWAKVIQAGQQVQLQVEREYMMEVVNKFCNGYIYPPIRSIASLILQLCNSGHVDIAWDLVQLVQERSHRNVYALSLMDEMTVKGVLPDVVTYNAMFRGLRDMTVKLIDDMKEHACNPNEATLEILTASGILQ